MAEKKAWGKIEEKQWQSSKRGYTQSGSINSLLQQEAWVPIEGAREMIDVLESLQGQVARGQNIFEGCPYEVAIRVSAWSSSADRPCCYL